VTPSTLFLIIGAWLVFVAAPAAYFSRPGRCRGTHRPRPVELEPVEADGVRVVNHVVDHRHVVVHEHHHAVEHRHVWTAHRDDEAGAPASTHQSPVTIDAVPGARAALPPSGPDATVTHLPWPRRRREVS
jgi:hypothetical protein